MISILAGPQPKGVEGSCPALVFPIQDVKKPRSCRGALAQVAGTRITEIDESTQQVVATVSDITTAIEEQRNATNEIARHVEQIAQMAQSNSHSTGRTGETARQLSTLSQDLQSAVARFRL